MVIWQFQPSPLAGELGVKEKVDDFPLKCIFISHLGHILFCLPILMYFLVLVLAKQSQMRHKPESGDLIQIFSCLKA